MQKVARYSKLVQTENNDYELILPFFNQSFYFEFHLQQQLVPLCYYVFRCRLDSRWERFLSSQV